MNWLIKTFRYWFDIFREKLKQPVFRSLINIAVIGLSLAFIAFILYRNWAQFSQNSIQFRLNYLLFAILCFPCGMVPTVLGWHYLLQSLGIKLPFRVNLRIYSISSLPKHVPGLVLHLTSRTILYQEAGVSAAMVLMSTAAEMMLLPLTGFMISALLFFLDSHFLNQYPAIRVAAGISTLILIGILFLKTPLEQLLKRAFARRSISFPEIKFKPLITSNFWMLVAWAGGGLVLYLLGNSIYSLPWIQLPIMIGIWGISGAVSMTLGAVVQGLGIREVTMGALLSLIMPPAYAVILAIAFRLVFVIAELCWVGLFVWITNSLSKAVVNPR